MAIDKKKDRIQLFQSLFQEKQLRELESDELLNLANHFSKLEDRFLESNSSQFVTKKIAILSSSTSHFFKQLLRLFLYQEGIAPIFYEAEFGSIYEQILNLDSELYTFVPDVLLLLPDYRDIKEMPPLFSSLEDVETAAHSQILNYQNLWQKVSNKMEHCQIFQGLFVVPPHRTMGALEANYLFSPQNYYKLLNLELIKNKPANVTLVDFDYHAANFGKSRWFDDSQYFQSKQAISFDALGDMCYAMTRIISSYFGKVKKCLVLDLDNTLWGGVIGDDGLEGINLNSHDPVGEAYLSFQRYIKALKERGVILAVCSKNEESTAQLPFIEHPEMILKMEDISCFIANWNDKSTNIRSIAAELNIGLDSLVFFDDNPAERAIVKQFLPEVEVINASDDPASYLSTLDRARCFDWIQLTSEDIGRSDSYFQNKKRTQLQEFVIDYDQYLKSLEMKASIAAVSETTISRFSQLINKSNQFNVRTKRYSEANIEAMINDPDRYQLRQITFIDKFGSYGLISCIILEKKGNLSFIDTWVMSCRVLKRGIEYMALNSVIKAAKEWGCDLIVGEYIPSAKNSPVKNLYGDLGFHCTEQSSISGHQFEGEVYTQKTTSDKLRTHHHISLDMI
jgi:FkbH-like protein